MYPAPLTLGIPSCKLGREESRPVVRCQVGGELVMVKAQVDGGRKAEALATVYYVVAIAALDRRQPLLAGCGA